MFLTPILLFTLLGMNNTLPSHNAGTVDVGADYLTYQFTQTKSGCYWYMELSHNFSITDNSYWSDEEDNVLRSFSVPIASFSLNDRDNNVIYEDFIVTTLDYEVLNASIVPDSRAFNFTIMDYEWANHPYLNYYFYAVVDTYTSPSNGNLLLHHYTTFDDGYDLIPLWQTQNFPSISIHDWQLWGYRNVIYWCFEYIEESSYDSIIRDSSNLDYQNGYQLGYQNGFNAGSEQGVQDYLQSQAYQDALNQQFELGELQGISEGRQQVIDQGQTASIIFNGIISVGLLPVNVFLQMLNLEVFGINIGALVSSLLTIMVIIIIVRMVIGGKSGIDK